MKKIILFFGSAIILGTALLALLWLYSEQGIQNLEKQYTDLPAYDRYYVLISQEQSDLWKSVYESASVSAGEHNAVLDWIGMDSPVEYSIEDCMRIAASSGADGILLHKDASDDLTDLIDAAEKKGIPVITVLNDESDSGRVSFVGINSYQMGEVYGRQVLEVLHEGDNKIIVLTDENEDNSSFGLMYTQMVQTIDNGKTPGQEVRVSTYRLNTETGFDAEEGIRDLFVRSGRLPDVIVCLDPTVTECVAQALVDYNQVGSMTVIGYYASDTILDAIRKDLVKATLGIDAGEIGRLCVEALDEYYLLGRVSNYFNVGISMITQENLPPANEETNGREEAEQSSEVKE